MTRLATVALALGMMTAACGGGDGTVAGPAGVDRSREASAVTEAEKGSLCDWYAPMVGGYGAASMCAGALIDAPPDQATCIADFPVCTGSVTIGVFEDCIVAIIAAQNTCTQASLMAAMTRSDCAAVAASGCFN